MPITTSLVPLSIMLRQIALTSNESSGLAAAGYLIWVFCFILPVVLALFVVGAILGTALAKKGNRLRAAALGILPGALFLLLSPILLTQPDTNKAYMEALTGIYKLAYERLNPQIPRQRKGFELGKTHLQDNDLIGAASVFLPLMTEEVEHDKTLSQLGPSAICSELRYWFESRTAPLKSEEIAALNALIDRCDALSSSRGYVGYLRSRAIVFASDAPDQATAIGRCDKNISCIDYVTKFYAKPPGIGLP